MCKPDQLIKRRGKAGLLGIKKTWPEVKEWISSRMLKEQNVEGVVGELNTFLIEPFCAHKQEDEYYLCIQSIRSGEEIMFYHEGGVDVGDVDAKGLRLHVPVNVSTSASEIKSTLLVHVPESRQEAVASFIDGLFKLYRGLQFAYMEINPLVFTDGEMHILDLAAKLDETAAFVCGAKWGEFEFPPAFGRKPMPEESLIRDMDGKTGASLKLTILNEHGRVWTMVAGGGASVVYADTISDLGFGAELANYGEYSGAPTEGQTLEYAKTVINLMCRGPVPDLGKVLIIGGGIANFTDVAATFKGIVKAIKEYQHDLQRYNVQIYIRRGGPNYQQGLQLMRDLGLALKIPIHVYGPNTSIVGIVPMALGLAPTVPEKKEKRDEDDVSSVAMSPGAPPASNVVGPTAAARFTNKTRCVVYGMQPRAVQGMLDFDFLCKREKPSVACMIFPFSGNHYQKFYWGTEETLIPVYQYTSEAMRKHPDIDVMINFASFRSVLQSTTEGLSFPQIRTIAIIAEGVPEAYTRAIIEEADKKNVMIIGPATVGGIKPGCFRIGNTGGMLDNIIASKLYRPGSVAYVSKSGGMSNELNNLICRYANGVYEGVAIGGDRYPGSRFIDHLLRFHAQPDVKMLVLLGEVGGTDEYEVCKAINDGRLTKPIVAWCIGTVSKMFGYEVQFGHAGACASGESSTADAKNSALKAAGAHVPDNFNEFGDLIGTVYKSLVANGTIVEGIEPVIPKMPMDYEWGKKLGMIRKPANFVSTIVDDRGEELLYAGMTISKVFEEDIGVGGVLSLLWFRRRLPPYATKFIEMILMVTADHGPAVSGAHNTIVSARAGKDLVSSVVSGLLTIGPRFGGALDEAAKLFMWARASSMTPKQFVAEMRNQNKLIMGIGHRIKSLDKPDQRVTIIKEYAKKHFLSTPTLDYALEVEQITTAKKANLILNVDGCIACCFVDLLMHCGAFDKDEADDLINNGCLNGLFVLGRSIGFIGHYLDQLRLKQGLYRHPWDDISYLPSDNL